MKEQCICIHFSFRLGENCIKNAQNTIAFGDSAVMRTKTFDWLSGFKHWETLLKDCDHSGHLSTGHIKKIWGGMQNLWQRPASIVLESAGRLVLMCGTCQQTLVELDVQQISVKSVPQLLSDSQMLQQFLAARNMAVILYPSVMPDLIPCDFLFRRMKLQLGVSFTVCLWNLESST